MKTSVLIILSVTVLIGALAVMNNACKSSQHEWCAPMSSIRHHIRTGRSWVREQRTNPDVRVRSALHLLRHASDIALGQLKLPQPDVGADRVRHAGFGTGLDPFASELRR
jgi:hypothetical protein